MDNNTSIISQETGWIVLAILSVIWVMLGRYWGKKASNMEGFMLAGRNVGLALGTATAMATWITSNTTMLAPQFALELGIWGMLAYCTASFGLFLFAPLAKRIKALIPNGYTSGDFIRMRYGKKTWYVFLIISLFYGFTWLISMGMAGGVLMNAISGIPYQMGMTVILTVCVLYTLFGGLYAVIGTDFIQSLIIMAGIVFIGYSILSEVDFGTIYTDVKTDSPMLLNALMPAAIIAIFNNLLFGVGEIFHSNVWWSRAYAMRKGIGQKAYLLAGLFWFPIPIAAGFLALTSGTLGLNITSPDMVGPLVSAHLMGKAGAVVVFIILFSSLASSIDSLLAATADLITEDIYKKMIKKNPSEKQLKKASASIIVGLGIVTWIVCMPRIGTLATFLFLAGPMVGSTIWPIITGLYWKKANATGALWAMVIGTMAGLISYYTLGWYTAALVGAGLSMLVTILFTWLYPADFDWSKLNEKSETNTLKESNNG